MIIYRGMKKNKKQPSKPQVGNTAKDLGVRRCGDVTDTPCSKLCLCWSGRSNSCKDIPIRKGKVRPNTGGMSVRIDPYMPHFRLPIKKDRWGTFKLDLNDDKCRVFSLKVDDLPACLRLSGKSNHRLIEPSDPCSFDDFQKNLQGTQHKWKELTQCDYKRLVEKLNKNSNEGRNVVVGT